MISWNVSREDNETITLIAQRAIGILKQIEPKPRVKVAELMMDITAAHVNGCPLDLPAILAADKFTFTHDVFGIHSHINRDTGKLEDCFVPRLAQR
jgi:hypothetical protein